MYQTINVNANDVKAAILKEIGQNIPKGMKTEITLSKTGAKILMYSGNRPEIRTPGRPSKESVALRNGQAEDVEIVPQNGEFLGETVEFADNSAVSDTPAETPRRNGRNGRKS